MNMNKWLDQQEEDESLRLKGVSSKIINDANSNEFLYKELIMKLDIEDLFCRETKRIERLYNDIFNNSNESRILLTYDEKTKEVKAYRSNFDHFDVFENFDIL